MLSTGKQTDTAWQLVVSRTLQEIINWGMFTTDTALNITGWNHWLEINTRLPAESVLGRNLVDLYPELAERHLDQAFHKALGGQVVVLAERLHKYLLPMPTTVARPGLVRMQQTARIAPLMQNGNVIGTLTLIEDVTERAVYDAELSAHAKQQAGIAELGRRALAGEELDALTAEAMNIFAKRMHIDQCAIFELTADGQTLGVVAGVGWREGLIGAERLESATGTYPGCMLAAKQPVVVNDLKNHPQLHWPPFLLEHGITCAVSVPLMANQKRLGVLGIFSSKPCDIHVEELPLVQAVANVIAMAIERRRLEGELRERVEQLALADQRKDEFLAMLAHELRNPLAPMTSALELLSLNELPSAESQLACDVIERQVGQMKRLIDDLLDIARITQGKISLQREVFDLAVVVAKAIEISRPLIDARRHALTLSLPTESLWVEGDPTRIAQVVANLMNNAAKYTDPGGGIWLAVERRADRVRLSVRDSGLGIAPEMLAHVFDLFTQVDRSLDRSQGGLGIGLTLVRRITEMHGGTVEALSAGPGQGSEFVIELPALSQPESRARQIANRTSGPGAPLRFDILVVDDNADAAKCFALLLQALGHRVRTASNGTDAIACVGNQLPEIVFLDIGLPGMDGYAVAEQLRSQNLLLVALTGYGRPEDRQRSSAAGFHYHLVKPVDRLTLEKLLQQIETQRNFR